MMYWYGGRMSGWGYAAITVGAVLFWTAVVVAVVALVRYLSLREGPVKRSFGPRPTAEEILAERFARGEMDQDEYRRRLDALHANGSTAAPV